MNKELKQRIEQINAGTAPAGYKKTKVGIVPEEWDTIKAQKIFRNRSDKKHDGTLEVLSVTQDRGVIPRSQVDIDIKYDKESTSSYKRVYTGDFVISLRSFQGGIEYSEYNGIVSPAYTVIEAFTPICDDYYRAYFKSPTYIQRLNTAVYGIRDGKNISFDDFSQIYIPCPPLPEQQKIAEILTAQDEVIALLQRQIDLLKQQKKGFLQKMFPKKGCKYPEIRFRGFTDDWNQYHLGDLYIERNENGNDFLPILSVSIHSGVSDGELDTETLGKFVRRSEDKSTYKHVFCGDLVFNMMRAWQGAIGVVKSEGMVSPAYISAIPNEKVYPPFMNYLLRRKAAVDQINDLSYGVTDFRKRLYWKSFIRVSCQLPSLQEQKMITELFESLDALIDQHQRKLELEQQKKKALMQLLLTGKVRVKT